MNLNWYSIHQLIIIPAIFIDFTWTKQHEIDGMREREEKKWNHQVDTKSIFIVTKFLSLRFTVHFQFLENQWIRSLRLSTNEEWKENAPFIVFFPVLLAFFRFSLNFRRITLTDSKIFHNFSPPKICYSESKCWHFRNKIWITKKKKKNKTH